MNGGWLAPALLSLGMQLAHAQERIAAQGEWRHPSADFTFPERVGEFSRIAINRYSQDYSDVSVGYAIRAPDGRITITLFVYTDGSDSPKSEGDLRIHFAKMSTQVGRSLGGSASAVPISEAAWPHWLAYEAEVNQDGMPPFRSILLLKTCGKWYTKVRASYSSGMAQTFEFGGRDVLELLNCSSDT